MNVPLTDTSRIILEKTGIFAGLPSDALISVRAFMEARDVPAGTVLFREGDSGDSVFVVRQGLVRILKEQDDTTVELAQRGPGEIIGEMALIDASPRFASAQCIEDTSLFVLSRSHFFKMLSSHPLVAERILHVLTARVREADTTRLRELESSNRDLRQAHQRLETALRIRQQILHVAPYPIVVTNPQREVLFSNPAAVSAFGLQAGRGLWQWINVRDVKLRHQADTAETSMAAWRGEMEIDGPDAQVLLCKVNATPISDTGDGTPGRLWVFEDLTEVRVLERQAAEHERLAMKGEMASEIAHELKNYLMVLSGHTDLMEVRFNREDLNGIQASLGAVHQTVGQMRVFVESLLHSRHPSGERCPLDLNAFLEGQIAFLQPQRRFKGIDFRTNLGQNVPLLVCDAAGLQQALYNLVLNSTDAMRAAATSSPTIHLATSHDTAGQRLVLSVADNGPGIPPDIARLLFKERVSSKPTGHGFGTLTVARIVAEHGGSIQAGTRAGGGAEFVLSFPVSQANS